MAAIRVGAARSVVTPTIGRWQHRNVHDDLYSKAVLFESGDTTIALVSVDVPVIAKRDADKAKAIAQEITGIPADNIMIAATHTHYAPFDGNDGPEYQAFFDWVAGRIADSIKFAQQRLQPALLAYGSGSVPGEGFNRRYWMKDGTVVFNPVGFEYRDDQGAVRTYDKSDIVRPAGPVDPELGVLIALAEDRTPIALLANFSLHYVDAPDYSEISANYFGRFERALQRMAGSDFVAVMLNGCCGDVNNEDYMGERDPYPYDYYRVDRVADVLAAEAYKVWRSLRFSQWRSDLPLAVAGDPFEYRLRSVTPEQVAAAKHFVEGREGLPYGNVDWLEWIHSRMIIRVSEQPPTKRTLVQAFRIGELGIASLPTEVFVEVGMDIKQRSPFPHTFVAELANDWFGYLPTDKAFSEGSYETLNSPCAVGTASALADCAVSLLTQLAD